MRDKMVSALASAVESVFSEAIESDTDSSSEASNMILAKEDRIYTKDAPKLLRANEHQSRECVQSFCLALMTCVPFLYAYLPEGVSLQTVQCPLGGGLKRWRAHNKLSFVFDGDEIACQCKSRFFGKKEGFISHLTESSENCIYHRIMLAYVKLMRAPVGAASKIKRATQQAIKRNKKNHWYCQKWLSLMFHAHQNTLVLRHMLKQNLLKVM